jgi:hypothetical protein
MRLETDRVRITTTIGRSIDFQVPTNRAIALLALGVFVAGNAVALVHGGTWATSLLDGLSWAGSVFLAWVLARETDPDRWYSAFLASAGGLASVVLLGPPSFLFLLWFVIALRCINRTTGAAPGTVDWAALYGIAFWLGFTTHWTIPLLTLPPVFFADIRRFPKPLRIGLPLALPTAAIILGITRGWRFVLPEWGWVEILLLTAIALLVAPVIGDYRRVRSVGDRSGQPLKPYRVQWALGWGVVTAIIVTFTGTATTQDLGPLWAALAGTSIGWAIERLTSRLGDSP